MDFLAITILVILSIVGFLAIFFSSIGTLLILIGALIYAIMTGFTVLNVGILFLFVVLYVTGELLEYVFTALGAKKFGASNASAIGAVIGGIIGAILGSGFLGLGFIFGSVFVGVFAGIFLGAFLVEYGLHKDLGQALKAGFGGMLGRIGAIAVKLIIAIIMVAIMVPRIIGSLIS